MAYEEMEAQDRERFERESAEADAAAATALEARQKAAEDTTSARGARARIEAERAAKEEDRERRRQLALESVDPEELAAREEALAAKKAETEERRRQKRQEEQALAKQHKKLDKEQAKKAAQRLEYLLKQSDIFGKLQGGGGKGSTLGEQKDTTQDVEASRKGRRAKTDKSIHHIHTEESNEEEEEEDTGGEDDHVFLSKQPSSIKFGQLKPYQLEALNWMIHLSEKGLNGILADEVS